MIPPFDNFIHIITEENKNYLWNQHTTLIQLFLSLSGKDPNLPNSKEEDFIRITLKIN